MAGLCSFFSGRLPSEIEAEIDRQPVGFLDEVIEAHAYRQAKQMTDAADTAESRKRLPDTPLFKLVPVIDREFAQEWREQQGRERLSER